MNCEDMPIGTRSGTPQILLGHHLKQLKLPTVLREYDKVARECARDGADHPGYLLRLIELELIDRERRTVERRIRAARFPGTKSCDTFDFTAIASLNKMLVLELARSQYILTMNGDSYRLRQSAGQRQSATAEQSQTTPDIIDPETGEITTP